MEEFLKRHAASISGVLSGFDRILFRGCLRSISYVDGMNAFLRAHSILLKNFGVFVERCGERVATHAEKLAREAGRPYRYLESSSARKEDIARQILAESPVKLGLICVLSCVEVCMGFDVRGNRSTQELELVRRTRKCRFFYFYFIDREFGLMHIRLQSWAPFDVQVCLNGRSYLAVALDREGIGYERRGNCFTRIDDLPRAQALMDRLCDRPWVKTLAKLVERVNPLLQTELARVFSYYWTTRESEFATDVMFKDAESLAAVYRALTEHALLRLSPHDCLRFLGYRRPQGFGGEVTTNHAVRPSGVRVKHCARENSIKMYDKERQVLRVETTINNPRRFQVLRKSSKPGESALTWRPMRKGVSDFHRIAQLGRAANARYLEALSVVGEGTPSHRILDPVSKPVLKDGRRHRGLRPISPPEAQLFRAVLDGGNAVNGFRNQDIQHRVLSHPARDQRDQRRRSAWVSRRLRLLRSHGLIRKVGNCRLYRITKSGHEVMATALAFRDSNVALLEARVV